MNHSPRQEILKHLRRDDSTDRFLLTEPHLLYLSPAQSQAYLQVMANPKYSQGFHSQTVQLVEQHCCEIAAFLDNPAQIVDLGPGYPDKSLPLARYLAQIGRPLIYCPVDISRLYLKIAEREMKPFAAQIAPVLSRFESCRERLPQTLRQNPFLLMLGLTFMNFEPEMILGLLSEMAQPGGVVLVASELLTSTFGAAEALSRYRNKNVRDLAFGPLQMLGVHLADVNYQASYRSGRIECSFQLIADPPLSLKKSGVRQGSEIVTAISNRYTQKEFTARLERHFPFTRLFPSKDGHTAIALAWAEVSPPIS